MREAFLLSLLRWGCLVNTVVLTLIGRTGIREPRAATRAPANESLLLQRASAVIDYEEAGREGSSCSSVSTGCFACPSSGDAVRRLLDRARTDPPLSSFPERLVLLVHFFGSRQH